MGINVCTPVNDLGYGTVGRNLVKAFDKIGANPALFLMGSASVPKNEWELFNRAVEKSKFYEAGDPSFRLFHAWDLALHPTRGKRSAATFFELDSLKKEEVYQLNQMDHVFAFGEWAARVMRESGVTADIQVIHCGVDRDIFPARPLPVDGPTRFISAGKWEIRKGHDILLQAFQEAFDKEDDVELVMLCDNPFLSPEETNEWVRHYKESPLGDKISIHPRLETQKEVSDLFATCHAGVFLSRGEGWNLEAMELLSMGRQVVATACTAHLDFLTPDNAYLVPVGPLEKAWDGKWFHGQGRWYQISQDTIKDAAIAMQGIHEWRRRGKLTLNKTGIGTANRYSWESAAQKVCEVLGVRHGV